MKSKNMVLSLLAITIIAIGVASGMVYSNNSEIFSKMAIAPEDIPQGFVFGKVPQFAKKIFPGNPCVVDANGIRFLAGKLYPDGNPAHIKSIYVAIMATNERPYGDDIVYYLVEFSDSKAAAAEIKKIEDFCQYNKDRMVVFTKDTITCILFADDVDNYKFVVELSEKLKSRLYQ